MPENGPLPILLVLALLAMNVVATPVPAATGCDDRTGGDGFGGSQAGCRFACEASGVMSVEADSSDEVPVWGRVACGEDAVTCGWSKSSCQARGEYRQGGEGVCEAESDESYDSALTVECQAEGAQGSEEICLDPYICVCPSGSCENTVSIPEPDLCRGIGRTLCQPPGLRDVALPHPPGPGPAPGPVPGAPRELVPEPVRGMIPWRLVDRGQERAEGAAEPVRSQPIVEDLAPSTTNGVHAWVTIVGEEAFGLRCTRVGCVEVAPSCTRDVSNGTRRCTVPL